MKIEITIAQSKEDILTSWEIRQEVFVQEQGIATALDVDGLDDDAFHAIAKADAKAVGVARLTLMEKNSAHLSRVAVKKGFRNKGIAAKLIDALLQKAIELNVKTIHLQPHAYLKSYYEALGFSYIEEARMVSGYPLINMIKSL